MKQWRKHDTLMPTEECSQNQDGHEGGERVVQLIPNLDVCIVCQ